MFVVVVVLLLLLLFCGVNLEIRKSCRAVDCAAFLAGETTSGEPKKEGSEQASVREEKRARARERERESERSPSSPHAREAINPAGTYCN